MEPRPWAATRPTDFVSTRWRAKVLLEEGSDRILGAHLLGADSEEVINLFALAIRSGTPAGELRKTLFAYPTRASDISYMV